MKIPIPKHRWSGGCASSGGAGPGSCARSARFATAAALIALALTLTPAFAADPAARPPVPIGVDPGGVLIAIIGDGVDYTQPDIAARLARDGEGELIGWDLIDNDRRPYGDKGSLQTATVRVVLGEPGTARVAIFRVDALPPAIRAVAMAAQAKARVMMLPAYGLHGCP